jgi:hypothetical protein
VSLLRTCKSRGIQGGSPWHVIWHVASGSIRHKEYILNKEEV